MSDKTKPDGKRGKPQDWSEIMKDTIPESVVWSLLQPTKPDTSKDRE